MIKNPNWQKANQLAIYKHGQGFEHRTTCTEFKSLASVQSGT